MNEEEKQAIEILNSQLLKTDGYDRHQKAIDIILKLIEKQQKEIEKLKDDLREKRAFSKAGLETLKECIHKDTIIAKIKELDTLLYGIEEREKLGISRADIGSINCLLSQIAILNSLI